MSGPSILSKARVIADALYEHCFLPDNGKRIRESGTIPPASTLKNKSCRAAFRWAGKIKHKKKYFTLSAVRKGIQRFLKMEGVEIPTVAGLPHELWLEQQSKLVVHLCQRTRKNVCSALRFPAYRQACIMDWQETIPIQAGQCAHAVLWGIWVGPNQNQSNSASSW